MPVIRLILLCLIPLPALYLAHLINLYGVNVPQWDQWELVDFFAKVDEGSAGPSDFAAQANESRLLFPRVIFLTLIRANGYWNVRSEMFLQVALAAMTLAGMVLLTRQSMGSFDVATASLLVLISAIVFSPIQQSNWLMGIQVIAWIPILCLVTILIVVNQLWPPWLKVFVSATLVIVATYSYANGMLLWPIGAVALWFGLRDRRREGQLWLLGVYLLIGVATVAVYFIGYQRPPHHPSMVEGLRQPVAAFQYLLGFLGMPLAAGLPGERLTIAMVVGGVMLALFLACSVMAVTRRTRMLPRVLPWMLIGAYSLASGVTTSLGRVGFGIEQSLAGRYATFAIFLSIAALLLLRIVLKDMAERGKLSGGPRAETAYTCVITAALAPAVVLAGLVGIDEMIVSRQIRVQARAALHWSPLHLESATIATLFPDPAVLRARAKKLADLELMQPGVIQMTDVPTRLEPGRPSAEFGKIAGVQAASAGSVIVHGIAMLPHRQEVADLVVLTLDEGGQPRFLAIAYDHLESPELYEATEIEQYYFAKWAVALPTNSVKAGTMLRAWAYDGETGIGHELAGAQIIR